MFFLLLFNPKTNQRQRDFFFSKALAVSLSGPCWPTGNHLQGVAAAIGFGGPWCIFGCGFVAFLVGAKHPLRMQKSTLGQIIKVSERRDNIAVALRITFEGVA